MKFCILLVLLVFSVDLFAKPVESVKVFAGKISKSKSYNENCDIGNYQLLANDKTLRDKIESALISFGGMTVADFDMGECAGSENIKENIFMTHFWQKNTRKLNHRLDLFIAYDFKDQRVLSVIIDNELNPYFIGDIFDDLKNALKTNPIYFNNFSKVNLDSNLRFLDLKEYKEEVLATPSTVLSKTFSAEVLPEVEVGSQWYSSCNKDRFDGSKVCVMSSGDVMVGIINGNYGVYVGGDHYPNTPSAIKIDNNPAIYGFEGHSRSPLVVIEQMKRGRVAYTRYKKWPYEYNKDGEVDLSGFTFKFNELIRRYKSL